MMFPGIHVRITKGEYAGKTGVIQSAIPMRYKKETLTYRVLIDGFPKPGGWNGKAIITFDCLEVEKK